MTGDDDINAADSDPDARRSEVRTPSARSLRGLDWINFLMADVSGGVGPYLAVFLKGSQHWQPGPIGVAMALMTWCGVIGIGWVLTACVGAVLWERTAPPETVIESQTDVTPDRQEDS